eukprot:2501151-Rhodomonas_salina.1
MALDHRGGATSPAAPSAAFQGIPAAPESGINPMSASDVAGQHGRGNATRSTLWCASRCLDAPDLCQDRSLHSKRVVQYLASSSSISMRSNRIRSLSASNRSRSLTGTGNSGHVGNGSKPVDLPPDVAVVVEVDHRDDWEWYSPCYRTERMLRTVGEMLPAATKHANAKDMSRRSHAKTETVGGLVWKLLSLFTLIAFLPA